MGEPLYKTCMKGCRDLCDCTGLVECVTDVKNSKERCSKIIDQPKEKPDVLIAAVEKFQENEDQSVETRTARHSSYEVSKCQEFTHPLAYTLLVKAISNKEQTTELVRKVAPEELKAGVRIEKIVQDGKVHLQCRSNLDFKSREENKKDEHLEDSPLKLGNRIVVSNIVAGSKEPVVVKINSQPGSINV